jgi:adenine-specific DNA methylase
MIPKECKRLAEVDFPIAVVSKHSAREKSIRHGHPSTLHLWWARRPLAACRAMLMALLLPDPCDPLCPGEFKERAKELLLHMPGWNTPRLKKQVQSDEGLRKALLSFIGDFADWDNSANDHFLTTARSLVKAAHPEETPLVVDPFAGGGSIPLEALRIGCEAFASDLNPVACLILKVMLEDIPREAHRRGAEGTESLADELRRIGKEIKKQAEKELAEFYPKDADGAVPIAYLWARTVRCESPNCGAEIPLMRSFWLCKKANRKKALRLRVVGPKAMPPVVEFEIFEPKTDRDVHGGTVTRAKATCPCCHMVLPPERVRAQLAAQQGGADVLFDTDGKRIGGARMLAVVTLYPGIQGRNYRLPTEHDYEAVWKAQKRLKAILDEWEKGGRKGLCPVPDEPTPAGGGSGAGRAFSVQKYGMFQWGDLFTARQKISLMTMACATYERPQEGDDALRSTMAMVIGRCADYGSSGVIWAETGEFVAHTFGRQALPIVWDFAEAVPWSDSSGNIDGAIDWAARVVEAWPGSNIGQLQSADATQHPLPDEAAQVWFTDPPYYDAVPYADLSDYFLVWLKRVLPNHPLLRDLFDPTNPLAPKIREAVQDETKLVNGRPKGRVWFEETMAKAFSEGRRVLQGNGIGSVVFAHKTTEGWEALLSGMIQGGWTITGSWPIATERPGRLRSQDSAALATSVHLVCRPRPEDAPVGDWSEVLRELPKRVGDWMERLQGEGIRGADLVFACIGPALEIFSRYSRVETADGSEVKLAEYLEKVWEVVGRTALEQVLGTEEARARNGMAGVLEEDARLTALFLWTLQSTNGNGEVKKGKSADEEDEAGDIDDDEEETPKGKTKGYSLVFDVVRRFAQPLGIDLPKWEGRVIETQKGVVRLMVVSERAKQLFGSAGMESAVEDLFAPAPSGQMILPGLEEMATQRQQKPKGRGRKIIIDDPGQIDASTTTLDRVHAAMLLQAGGQANALRMLIKSEQDRGSDFLRLANALSALYPSGSEEKRLLDAMLLAAR